MHLLVNRLQQKAKPNTRKAKVNNPQEKEQKPAKSRSDGSHEEADVAENADRRYGDSALLLESERAPPIEAPMRNEEENEESLIDTEPQDNSTQRIAEGKRIEAVSCSYVKFRIKNRSSWGNRHMRDLRAL